jgi:ParB/RepB/Spo0J family partition protein
MASSTNAGILIKFKRKLAYIDVDKISPNPNNPREPIARKEIADIRESIRLMGGVLVPIVVYQEGERYILLDGERRWRACLELSKEDYEKYGKIPANIIEKPPTPIQNLQTMFNIHQKRREWSTAAKAEAIGKLLQLRGSLSVGELSKLTGLDNVSVNDALILLRFPDEIRKRCLDGELDEFYPILLGRNLKTLEKIFPSLFEKYSWQSISSSFLKKVNSGFIRRARDFNKLGQMARTCISYQHEYLFEFVFERMLQEDRFTPRDAQREIERELGYRLEISFRNTCNEFLQSLKSYLKGKHEISDVPNQTFEILCKIYETLRDMVKQKKVA